MHRYRRKPRRGLLLRRAIVLLPALLLVLWLITQAGSRLLSGMPWWRSAVPPQQITPLRPGATITITGGPSLNAAMVDGILAAYHSPLQGHGAEIVALSTRYAIDDAPALAFFVMESRAGTEGEAVLTHSFGNLRPKPDQPQLDGYRLYKTWMEGAAEWFSLMRSLYVDRMDRRTIDDVVPVYAPAGDHNDPPSMTAGIKQLVACWRGNVAQCPDQPVAVHTLVANAQRV